MSAFTFDPSGTVQQIAWAEQAIALCTYPIETVLEEVAAAVSVVWVDTLPDHTDSTHPYMVTEVEAETSFLVSIPRWADDPTAPELQGLPDPGANIQAFYMECFIHEIGHIVSFLTVDIDDLDPQDNPQVATVCAFFWRASIGGEAPPAPIDGTPEVTLWGSLIGVEMSAGGRRYGTPDDWEGPTGHPALAWADEIREAVAETFKMLFTDATLVYGNRTNWRISKDNAELLATMLGHPVTGSYTDTVTIWDGDPMDGGVAIASFSQLAIGSPAAVSPGWVWPQFTGMSFDNFRVIDSAGEILFADSFASDDSASYLQFPANAEIADSSLDFDVVAFPLENALIPNITTDQDFTVVIEVVDNSLPAGNVGMARGNTPTTPFSIVFIGGDPSQIFIANEFDGPRGFVSVAVPFWITDSVVYSELDVPIFVSTIQNESLLRGATTSPARPTGRITQTKTNPLTMAELAVTADAILAAHKKITPMMRRALIWQRAQDYRVKTRLGLSPTQGEIEAFSALTQSTQPQGSQQKANPGTLRGALTGPLSS